MRTGVILTIVWVVLGIVSDVSPVTERPKMWREFM